MPLKDRELRLAYAKKHREENKEKIAVADKKYREENKEEIKIRAKKRKEEHPETLEHKIAEAVKDKKYKDKNREEINIKAKKRRKEHPETLEHKIKKAAQSKKSREEHPEIFKERHRRYHEENPDKIYEHHVFYKYGLKKEEYDKIYTKQKGKCALCGEENIRKGKLIFLCVDHDHKTGKIRGLLCDKCNLMLSMIEDDVNLLPIIQKYLTKNNVRTEE